MRATTRSVTIGWLKAGGFTRVGVDVPDHTTWGGTDWIQVTTGVGGSPRLYTKMRQPVVQIDCWAANETGRALWTAAEQLAELVLDLCYLNRPILPTMPVGTVPVRIHSVNALTEPHAMPGDADSYARVSMDIGLFWTEV